jgi:hypothetical protein
MRGDEFCRGAIECWPSMRQRFLFKPFDLKSLIEGVRQLSQHA